MVETNCEDTEESNEVAIDQNYTKTQPMGVVTKPWAF